ncbi:MAG: hypothetical protein IPP49_20950 [Saprospiraceae bacterium]|nr:hypothetical protein [Saprospiraceae bacterium]
MNTIKDNKIIHYSPYNGKTWMATCLLIMDSGILSGSIPAVCPQLSRNEQPDDGKGWPMLIKKADGFLNGQVRGTKTVWLAQFWCLIAVSYLKGIQRI